MKRTATVRFELTMHQNNQLRALGRALWPEQNLPRDEICRRVLLEGADRMLRPMSADDRLLEGGCTPSPKPSLTTPANPPDHPKPLSNL